MRGKTASFDEAIQLKMLIFRFLLFLLDCYAPCSRSQ
ncbi:hypothetical protein BTU51_1457 [Rickettsia rickettsii]|uniref:Uncharacterized protein n=1 Tax=Rickettsia rickettsii (strain Iowa) TaxID=452659 RepID=B0BVC8_RICRO|nr:hypothetical protein RrIowa_1457 [Rickettsia rickettsii str. Iowa]APU56138.1 hypothetical protein BTU50_1457 [Rickettsia rickettsii]APU57515.1 hypothetical protein BTU51_1457 [Rickettsia rickettsii]